MTVTAKLVTLTLTRSSDSWRNQLTVQVTWRTRWCASATTPVETGVTEAVVLLHQLRSICIAMRLVVSTDRSWV